MMWEGEDGWGDVMEVSVGLHSSPLLWATVAIIFAPGLILQMVAAQPNSSWALRSTWLWEEGPNKFALTKEIFLEKRREREREDKLRRKGKLN